MKRTVLVWLVLLAGAGAARAEDLQDELRSRWLGAWIILTAESYSDCSSAYTNNRVNGNLVQSSGAHRFPAGELGKLDRVDLKRSRLDLLMTLGEPMLLPYHEGPFTLYQEVRCRVELEVEVPRQVVKAADADAVEALIGEVAHRYATEDEARAAGAYNGRRRQPYPQDYERTLARLAVWRAEQTNLAVQAQHDRAVEETVRLIDRLDEAPAYLEGFAKGVRAARAVDLESCPTLLSIDLARIRRLAAEEWEKDPREERFVDGYQDGKVLVYGLEMVRHLPACYVPVPPLPPDADVAGVPEP